jgi:hypothetical protein
MSGGGRTVTVGFWYSMGLHFGLCHGPVDSVRAIDVGERRAFTGNVTGSGRISIHQPNLFGGESREGGLLGDLDIMMGESSQPANDYLTAVQGTPQPAYRGILSAVWRGGRVAAQNPYVKPWAFLVRRTRAGWGTALWNAARAEIGLPGGELAMNPAHIIYECLTNPHWGMGYGTGLIDAANFAAAADTFHAEGLGLCLAWQRQDTIERFIQTVADHAGAVVGQDRRTGLFVIRPVRGGYSVPALPLFHPGNVLELASLQRPGTAEQVNEITVTYTDLAQSGREAAITVHNLAAIQAQGGVVAATRAFPGLPTAALAARIAERELRVLSTPLAKLSLRVNRDAWALLPGDVIRLTWPPLGITDMPLRILSVDWGSLRDGAITLEAAEDVFGLPATSYAAQQPGLWSAPSTVAHPAPVVAVWEASYVDLVRAFGPVAIPAAACYLVAAAARPAGLATHYELHTRLGTAAFAEAGQGDWSPTGTLSAAVGPAATVLPLAGTTRLAEVVAGVAALVGTEIVRVVAVDTAAGTLTVARGCADTVAAAWPAGTRVWVQQGFGANDSREYAPGETVHARFITVTTADRLADASAPSASLLMDQRQHRPYPPGRLRLNGAAYPASVSGPLAVSWAHRDRITQSDQLIDEAAASIGPEAGTTYSLEFHDETGALRRTVTGLTGTTRTWDEEIGDSARTVFSRDWTDGLVTGQTLFGGGTPTHSVVGGRYRLSVTAQGRSRFDAIAARADGAAEVDIVVPSGAAIAGIVYRSTLASGWTWAAWIDTGTGHVRLARTVPSLTIVSSAAVTLTPGATVRLRVEFVGQRHRIWLGATPLIDVNDVHATAAGEVGLLAGDGTVTVDFDNFALTRLNTSVRIRLWSERAGLASTQRHDVTVGRT